MPPHQLFFQCLNASSSSWSSSQHSSQLPARQCTRAHAPLTTSLLTTCFSPLHYSLLTTHYLLLTILSTHYSLLLLTSYYSTLHPLTALLLTNHYSLFTHSLLCYSPTITHSPPTHCSPPTNLYFTILYHAMSCPQRHQTTTPPMLVLTKPLWLPPPPQLRPRHSPDAPHQRHLTPTPPILTIARPLLPPPAPQLRPRHSPLTALPGLFCSPLCSPPCLPPGHQRFCVQL